MDMHHNQGQFDCQYSQSTFVSSWHLYHGTAFSDNITQGQSDSEDTTISYKYTRIHIIPRLNAAMKSLILFMQGFHGLPSPTYTLP